MILAALIVLYEFGLRYRTVAITRVGQLMLKRHAPRYLHAYPDAALQLLRFAPARQDPDPRGQLCEHAFDTLSSGLINGISDVFTFVITLIVMFVIDWQLAL